MIKLFKIIIATLGAINTIYGMFIPIALALLVVKFYSLNQFSQSIVLIAGSLSSLFKAIDVAFLKGD